MASWRTDPWSDDIFINIFSINFYKRYTKLQFYDLQISYNDTTFTDGRSKVSFADFLVKSISY